MNVSIQGLDKAEVLKALHDNSKAQGMGFLHFEKEGLSVDQCRELLEETTDFDYLQGRVMKVNLSGDSFDAWGYDRDNGEGAAEKAIAHLRESAKAAI